MYHTFEEKGDYVYDMSEALRKRIQAKVGPIFSDGKPHDYVPDVAVIAPTKDGNYKGAVLLDSKDGVLQQVGENTTVLHRAKEVEMDAAAKALHDSKNPQNSSITQLVAVPIEVQYNDGKGTMKTWDREKETEERAKGVETATANKNIVRPQIYPESDIPAEMQKKAEEVMRGDVTIKPPREGGKYKGEVVLNREEGFLQKVGDKSLIYHRHADLELTERLKWLNENKRLQTNDVQVYYEGSKGKAYPWDREKEATEKTFTELRKRASVLPDADRETFLKGLEIIAKHRSQAPEQGRGPEHVPAGAER